MKDMKNLLAGSKPNISRRKFCSLFAILPCGLMFNPAQAATSLVVSNATINKIFTENSKRVGEWMIEHLTLNQSEKIINDNMVFIKNLSSMTDTAIGHLISEDFIDERVIDICSCRFSTKEASICILSAHHKGKA